MRRAWVWLAVAVTGAVLAGGCTEEPDRPVTVQPGAPGETGQVHPDGAPRAGEHPHTAADVEFMHAMIRHHAQALRMTGLVAQRSERDDIATFARRIEISQQAEIDLMEGWLDQRETGGSGHSGHHHGPDAGLMPGMLTQAQFAELEDATGAEFDRLFLELMIFHHEGAVTMVADLRSSGEGQEPEISQLLTHIDIDQRIEIDRMRNLLAQFNQE